MMQASCELDKHALSAADLEAAAKLRNLPAPSQSLLLRLLLRKGPWFRVDSLWYEDVEDKEDAVRALHAAGFLQLLAAEPATGTRGVFWPETLSSLETPFWISVSDRRLSVLKPSSLPIVWLAQCESPQKTS